MKHLDILLVRAPWARKLVSGEKQWELRSKPTMKRGRIAIGQTGERVVVGEAAIVDCRLVAVRDSGDGNGQWKPTASGEWLGSLDSRRLHGGVDFEKWPKNWKKVYAWIMSSACQYQKPVPYRHVNGCQTWIASEANRKQKATAKRRLVAPTGAK
eukprot:Skav228686  [mRNA]  locus=scaffold2247:153627:154091:- [translate_table: standard]